MGNGKKLGCLPVFSEEITSRLFGDDALAAKVVERGAEGGGAHAAAFAQVLEGDGLLQGSQGMADALGRSFGRGGFRKAFLARVDVIGIDQGQGQCRAFLGQLERDVIAGGRGAVFGGEGQFSAATAHVKVGVAPAMQFARAAQGLAGTRGVGSLAGVVHEQDGELMFSLQMAQEGEQGSHLRGVVFIDAM